MTPLRFFALSLLVVSSRCDASVDAPARTQPNIIWLQTDSMDGRLLDPTSTYFQKIYMTGIRRLLLANGVNFARHYTASPQCVPSRTSMVTGRYVSETSTTNNGEGIARSTKTGKFDSACLRDWGAAVCAAFAARQSNINETFLDVIERAGYDMQLFARFDVGAGVIDDYPAAGKGASPSGDGFHGGPSLVILARGAGVRGETKGEPYNTSSTRDADPYDTDTSVGADVAAFLENRDPASARPFFLWMGLLAPHPPYRSNATYIKHVNASAIDAPVLPARAAMHTHDVDMSILKNCFAADYTDAQLIEMRTAYWGAVGEAMAIVDQVLNAARTSGHLNNTWVLYTSDHGEMSMEHRMDFKNNLREPSTRVPLIMTPFGVPGYDAAAGRTVLNFSSHIDILPTLLDLVGAPIPSYARGQSLVPLLLPSTAATAPPRRPYVVAEYHSNLALTGSFMIRQANWKLIVFGHTFSWFNSSAYPPQLFDVDADPFEMHDVSVAHGDVVSSLFATLEEELGGAGAVARIDETQMARNWADFSTTTWGSMTPEELLAVFSKTFNGAGNDASALAARITAWKAAAAQLKDHGVA